MSKDIGFCEICGTEIEVKLCCSGHMCGCMGLPVDPPVCSEKCYDIFMSDQYKEEKESTKSSFPLTFDPEEDGNNF